MSPVEIANKLEDILLSVDTDIEVKAIIEQTINRCLEIAHNREYTGCE